VVGIAAPIKVTAFSLNVYSVVGVNKTPFLYTSKLA
jgi:hypothetical protein